MMHIGKANARFDYYMQKNVNEVTLINKCTKEKDIGVIFDENLSFDAHIQSTINKANSTPNIYILKQKQLSKTVLRTSTSTRRIRSQNLVSILKATICGCRKGAEKSDKNT